LGCKEKNTRLRDTSRQILDLVPVDSHAKTTLMSCFPSQKHNADENFNRLKNFYFHVSPTQMLYNLKTTFIKLAPASQTNEINEIDSLYIFFLNGGGLVCLLNILTQKQTTDQCDITTRKSIYLIVLYILKRFLVILGLYQLQKPTSTVSNDSLEQILSLMPQTTIITEQQHISISLEKRIAGLLIQYVDQYPIPKHSFLQYTHIIELIRLIWSLASNNKQVSLDAYLKSDFNGIHKAFKQENVSFDKINKSNIKIVLSKTPYLVLSLFLIRNLF
jgi:hypothetical protein